MHNYADDEPSAVDALAAVPASLSGAVDADLSRCELDAKAAIAAKLLKHLGGFLGLVNDALLLSVLLHPATRTLEVANAGDDLTAYLAKRREYGHDLLRNLLSEQLVEDGRKTAPGDAGEGQDGDGTPMDLEQVPKDALYADLLTQFAEKEALPKVDLTKVIFDTYISKAFSPRTNQPLQWWLGMDVAMRRVAAPYLSIQASSAASERVFSVAGYVGRSRRVRLLDFRLESQTLMKRNREILVEYLRSKKTSAEVVEMD